MPLRRLCVIGTAILSLVGSITLGIRAADAGDSTETLTITVDRPTPGATISVAGHNCFGFKVLLFLTKHHKLLDSDAVVPDEAGDWSGSLTIPDRSDLVDKTLTISAKCRGDDTQYEPAFIVVVPEDEPPATTVPPTTAPPTTAPPGDGGGAPGAGQPPAQTGTQPTGRTTGSPPARPVDGAPTFTG